MAKSKFYRRSTFRKSYPQYKNNKIYKIAKKAASAVLDRRTEWKYIDWTFSVAGVGTDITSTGYIRSLATAISQGTGVKSRIGNQITLRRIAYDVNFYYGDTTNHIRMLVGRTHWGADASATGGLPNVDGAVNTDKYKIWKDKQVFLNNTHWTGKELKGSINLNQVIKFSSDPSTDSNNYYPFIYFVSDSSAAPHPTLYGYCRIYYTDE